jgi:hypothetical protein
VIGAILQIIASVLRLIPGWYEKRVDKNATEWKDNREVIDRELGSVAWWVRDNKSDNEHLGGS